jgi:hypothetical protein
MPYIIRPKGIRRGAALLFGTMLVGCAAPAIASANAKTACPSSKSSAALARYGDHALYTLLAGSSFEAGASGWTLTGAQASGEAGVGSSNSLAIGTDGLAVSPSVCVSSEYPTFRFFARRLGAGARPGSLGVGLIWTDIFGFSHDTPVAFLAPGEEWTLSPVLRLGTALPLWMPGSTLQVKLAFQASGEGSWAIDDVYIDPYSR